VVADGEPMDTDPVNVQVLGTPALLDADGSPVRGLRTKSVELLMYLTMHPGGATQADILAAVWPGVPAERRPQRLSTCLANLRNVIRALHESADPATETDARPEPIINTAGTYRLDPAIVTVDWWPTAEGSPNSARVDGANDAQWSHAIGEALDSLDEHTDYPWIDTIRQRAHRDSAALDHRGDP